MTPKSKPRKLVGFPVVKYEIAEDKVRFFNQAGLFKKRWIVVREFPVYEIEELEHLDSWLSLSWNNEIYQFILKHRGESFAKLVQQIAELQEGHQKNLQKTQQTEQCKSELMDALNSTLPLVDCLFDILMGLHEKRVNWMNMENYVQTLGGTFNSKPQTLMPLTLDFSKVALAVQNQTAKETAQETFDILRAIYAYFSELDSQEDLIDTVPNFGHVLNIVLAYFTLNDLWVAKVIGEADTQSEFDAFRGQLTDLATQTNFRVDADEFFPIMAETDTFEDSICNTRLLFRECIKQL